jgi:hypothetical protein
MSISTRKRPGLDHYHNALSVRSPRSASPRSEVGRPRGRAEDLGEHVWKERYRKRYVVCVSNEVFRTNKTDGDARALVSKLDACLSLSTAGAYLEHVTTSFAEYLQL